MQETLGLISSTAKINEKNFFLCDMQISPGIGSDSSLPKWLWCVVIKKVADPTVDD